MAIFSGTRTRAILLALALLGMFHPHSALSAESSCPETISLSDALALALRHNPELAVFSWDIRAAEARQIQAALRPNPELSMEIEDIRLGSGADTQTRAGAFDLSPEGWSAQVERGSESGAQSGFSEAQFTVALSQLIELGGKRARRMQLAERERDVSAWDYEVARADLLKEVAQAFVAVLAAQSRVELEHELVQLAEQVHKTVSERVNAGRVSPLEATRAQTALESVQIQAEGARRNLEALRAGLAALWGDTEARFERAGGTLEKDVRGLPPLEELQARIAKSPDLSRWQAEVEKRESAILLERAQAAPDITAIAGFRATGLPESDTRGYALGADGLSYSSGRSRPDRSWDKSLVLGLSVPLPLFDRNQGAILEAGHLASQAGEQRRATEIAAHSRLKQSYESLSTAHATLSSLRERILPAATGTFDAINSAYRQGKFGYLDVLDSQRTLYEARQQYLEALTAYHTHVSAIERTIGAPLWEARKTVPRPEEEK